MGTDNSKFLPNQQLSQEYRPLKQFPGVYENILNGSRIQKHQLSFPTQSQIIYEQDIFIFRKLNSQHIITTYYFSQSTSNTPCNMPYQICYFTQYPFYVMSSDLQLSIQQGLNLFIQCLKGFSILYNKFGPFNITSDNIFFNLNHQPKVWISSNLSKTHLDFNISYSINQQKMIKQLFTIFLSINDHQNLSSSFTLYLKNVQNLFKKKFTFNNLIIYLIQIISDNFISKNSDTNSNFIDTKTTNTTKQSINHQSNQSNQNLLNISKHSPIKQQHNSKNTISLKIPTSNKSTPIPQNLVHNKLISPIINLPKFHKIPRSISKSTKKCNTQQYYPNSNTTQRNYLWKNNKYYANCHSAYTVLPTSPITQELSDNFRISKNNYQKSSSYQLQNDNFTQFHSQSESTLIDKVQIPTFKQIASYKIQPIKMKIHQINYQMIQLQNPIPLIENKSNSKFIKKTFPIDHFTFISLKS